MRIIPFAILLLIITGCSPGELFKCKGLPGKNAAFFAMYFVSENEGYLVGNVAHFEAGRGFNSFGSSPYTYIDSTEGVVYKTTDAGKNWIKVNANLGMRYATAQIDKERKLLYILTRDDERTIESNIIKLSLQDNKQLISKSFEGIYSIWLNDTTVNFCDNGDRVFMYTLNPQLQFIDTTEVYDYFDRAISNGSSNFGIASNEGLNGLVVEASGQVTRRNLPLQPDNLALLNDSVLLISGRQGWADKGIKLIKYHITTNHILQSDTFKNYTLISNILVSGKYAVACVSNYGVWSNSNDIYYSTDYGKTWKLKPVNDQIMTTVALQEKHFYIYEGGSIMKRIELVD